MATGTQETLGTRWGQLPGRVMSGRTQALPVLVPGSWSNFPISPLFAVALKDPRQGYRVEKVQLWLLHQETHAESIASCLLQRRHPAQARARCGWISEGADSTTVCPAQESS